MVVRCKKGVVVMTVSTIHTELAQGRTRKVYMFTGSEWRVQRIYIEQIAKVAKMSYKYVNAISDVYASLTSSLFGSTSNVYVIRDDSDALTNEKLQAQLKSKRGFGNNIIILLFSTIDKRKKFFTQFKDEIVEFEPLKSDVLKKYISKEIELSDRCLDILIEVCEGDYGRCLLEIDKINRHLEQNKDKALMQMLEDGTIYIPPRDAVFKFVDAVLKRQKQMFELLKESYEAGEATLVLLSVLYNSAKQLLQVQACESKDVAKVTGLLDWQIRNAREKLGKWSNGELVHLMRIIQKAEKGVKIGTIDDAIAVEYVILNCL